MVRLQQDNAKSVATTVDANIDQERLAGPILEESACLHEGRDIDQSRDLGALANAFSTGQWGERLVSIGPAFPADVLALGVDHQNTVCVGRGQTATMSEIHSDLNGSEEFRRFLASSAKLERHVGSGSLVIGHDLQPHLLSTLHARRLSRMSRRSVAVQHHHAHAISCALDVGLDFPVIAVVCDGSGYGLDGAIWGGEILSCAAESFSRLAHLDYFPLPGGEAAIRSPWRSAMGVVFASMPDDWSWVSVPTFSGVDPVQRRIATQQLETGRETRPTSSLGRLFDAVAVLLELCRDDTPEGQAGGVLEALAGLHECPPYRLSLDGLAPALGSEHPAVRLNWRPMMREIIADIGRGMDSGIISARFHATIVTMLAEATEWGVRTTGIGRVVLSGGCFANQRLREGLTSELRKRGVEAKAHDRVPTSDAGLSLGQAYVASCIAAKGR